MFGLNMYQCAVGSIDSYEEAVAFYKNCSVKGGHDYGDARPIKGKESSKQMNVSVSKDDEVRFRYHNTDVVVWCPDGSYVIESYPSRSTCTFANCFIPRAHHLTKEGARLQIGEWSDGILYPVLRKAVVRGDHVETTAEFLREAVDRKGSKVVLATTRYAEYREWHGLMYPMVAATATGYRQYLDRNTIVEMLADPDRWHDLMMSREGTPAQVRETIYSLNRDQCYRVETAKALPASKGNNTWSTVLL